MKYEIIRKVQLFCVILAIVLTILIFINHIAFAEGFKTIRGEVYQKQDGTFAKDEWLSIDSDGDNFFEWYFFNSFGFKVSNMQVQGYDLDSQGRWVKDGIIQYDLSKSTSLLNNITETTADIGTTIDKIQVNIIKEESQLNITNTINNGPSMILSNSIKNNTNNSSVIGINQNKTNEIGPIVSANTINASNTIITNENVNSSAEAKKLLKNSITGKSGITFHDTKKVCNQNWVNVISMNGNNSYIKANSGSYNCLSMEVGINAIKDGAINSLSIYVDEMMLETIDEFTDDPQILEFYFDPKSDIMLVYNATAEEGSYLSTDNKTLYIRNAKFKTKTEKY